MNDAQIQTSTITVQVKFFASMRERLGVDEQTMTLPAGSTITDLWKLIAGEAKLPANTLVAVNLEYEDAGHVVHNGDEVAFFPPVTGG